MAVRAEVTMGAIATQREGEVEVTCLLSWKNNTDLEQHEVEGVLMDM